MAAVLAFVLSLGSELFLFDGGPGHGTGIPLPGTWIAGTPLLKQALPVRYTVFFDLFAGLVLAVAIDALHTRRSPRNPERPRNPAHARRRPWSTLAPAALAIVAVLPLVPAWPERYQGVTTSPPTSPRPPWTACPRGR